MEQLEILAIFDREQRRDVQFYPFEPEITPHVVRHLIPDPERGESMVIYSQLDADNVEAVISGEIAYFESIGHNFEWKVYDHDLPSDLRQRLLSRGFQPDEPEAVLVLDLEQAPLPLLEPVTLDVRQITVPAQIEVITSVQRQVWPEKDFIQWLADDLRQNLQHDPDHIGIFAAYVDDVPASCAWIKYHSGSQFAGLWGGATLPQYRQRGLYTALVAARLQQAIARGVRFLTIDASSMSHAVLKQYGFELLTRAHACKWQRGKTSKK